MSYTYHYGISQNKFHYPKNPFVALLFNPSLLPELLDTTDFFLNLCIFLPFPEYEIILQSREGLFTLSLVMFECKMIFTSHLSLG